MSVTCCRAAAKSPAPASSEVELLAQSSTPLLISPGPIWLIRSIHHGGTSMQKKILSGQCEPAPNPRLHTPCGASARQSWHEQRRWAGRARLQRTSGPNPLPVVLFFWERMKPQAVEVQKQAWAWKKNRVPPPHHQIRSNHGPQAKILQQGFPPTAFYGVPMGPTGQFKKVSDRDATWP